MVIGRRGIDPQRLPGKSSAASPLQGMRICDEGIVVASSRVSFRSFAPTKGPNRAERDGANHDRADSVLTVENRASV